MSLRKRLELMNKSISAGFNTLLPTRGRSGPTSPMLDVTQSTSRTPQNNSQTYYNSNTGGLDQGPRTSEQASLNLLEPSSVRALGDSPRAGGWASLNLFRKVVGRSAGAFGPLEFILDDLASCEGIYESAAGVCSDFQRLKVELEDIFKSLAVCFSGNVRPTITISAEAACRDIQNELEYVKREQNRGATRQVVEDWEDADQVLECYRRIQGHLHRLRLNVDTTMGEPRDEKFVNARLRRLSPSRPSLYNSNQATKLGREGCTPGTRVEVLEQMHSWIYSRPVESIYWLNGMAGTGKTTIAYSLCARLALSRNLGACFFCSRHFPECRDLNRIVPTIAYQLAQFSLPFRYALVRALVPDPDLPRQAFSVQFEKLLAIPLKEVGHTLPEDLVVVIDALDECEGGGLQRFLETLLTMTPDLPIKLFLTSRPGLEIINAMRDQAGHGVVSKLVLHELDKATVQGDIEIYLRETLRPIRPSESDILTLVERAGVLFIYAAAVVRYICYANFSKNPHRRFENVLSGPSTGWDNPYREIDELYTMVLEAALGSGRYSGEGPDPEDRNDTKEVLYTVLCSREPLTIGALSGLLGLHNVDRVHAALAPLWSVLHILEPDGLVTTLHESFLDFMFDPSRSQLWHCNTSEYNHTLTKRCLDYLEATKPHLNICGLESSCVRDGSVPGLDARIQTMSPREALYACRYWEQHLQSAVGSSSLLDRLDSFLSSRLLLWMEILNLNGYIAIGAEMLRRVEEWCVRESCAEDLQQLVHDAWRFMTVFASNPLSQSTPHIYVSMLPCWPTYSPIAKHYAHLAQKMICGTAIANRSLTLLCEWPIGEEVNSLTWSPSGICIAFISSGRIYVRDSISGHPVLGPLGPRAHASRDATAHRLTSIEFSPDGARIVSASGDGTMYVWDSKTGNQLLELQKGHTRRINSVVFSSDNRTIASGSEDGAIQMWDAQNGDRFSSLMGHTDSVTSVAFSPGCTRLVSGSDDRTLRIWNVETGQSMLGPLQGHTNSVSSVVCSSDGTTIASGSYDNTVRVWSAQTGTYVSTPFKGHTGPVHSVAFSPDATHIISGSEDRTIRMWDAQTGELMANPFEGHTSAVNSVAFSPDGTRIASASNDKSVRMWDARAEQPRLSEFQGHTGYVSSVAFSPDGTRIASSSQDKTIRMWDAQNGKLIREPLPEHATPVMSVAFSPDGTRIVTGSQNNTIEVWDVQTGQPKLSPLKGHTKSVSSVAFSPNGTRIISGSYDRTIRMWDAQTGRSMMNALQGHTDLILSVALSPEGARIVSGSDDKTIRIWDVATGKPSLSPIEGHTSSVTSVAFSPDGTHIASGSFDGTIRMWDAQTGRLAWKSFEEHGGSVFSVAFSSDGTRVASASYDKTIRIWDTRTGQPLLSPFEGHTNGVSSVSFSPDGTRIASGSYDSTIRAWDARTEVHMPSGSPLASPFSWEITEDGWIVESDNKSNLLAWIPSDLRHLLLPPRAIFVTSKDGYLRLDFESAHIGTSWNECYQPHVD